MFTKNNPKLSLTWIKMHKLLRLRKDKHMCLNSVEKINIEFAAGNRIRSKAVAWPLSTSARGRS
jgi:hypothetical protein